MITFHQPLWIAAGCACCLIVWLLWRHYERVREIQVSRFAAESLVPALTANVSPTRRRTKKWLLLLSILLCFTALARPQYGHRWINVKHKGIDILFALDTSTSMLAEDVRPNRLERGKLAVLDFVSKLTGDRVGLMPFAGTSYLMCPLTADYSAFEQSLMAVDQRIIPHAGTNIDSAIDGALSVLTGTTNHKILILITDGEQLQGDIVAAAKRAADKEMIVYTVGVGTEHGELIPDPETGGFVQDSNGSYVKSRLDRKNLQLIARTTDGMYVDLGNRGQGLETIYQQKLALVPQTELSEKRKQVPIERFAWPLALAIFLLSIEAILSERKSGKNGAMSLLKGIAGRFRRTVSMVVLLFTTIVMTPPGLSASEAEDAYAEGNFIEADQQYEELLAKDPDDPLIIFNHGATAYKNNRFEEAAEAFDRALASTDLHLQEKSYFNRGNAFFRLGEAALQAQPYQTIGNWERALASYLGALALNPDNNQAAENYAFVKTKLEQLKEQQHEQRNRQNQNNDEQSDADQNKDNGGGAKQQDNTDNQKDQSPGQESSPSNDNTEKELKQGDESANQEQEETSPSNDPEHPQRAEQSGAAQHKSPEHDETAVQGSADTNGERMSREEALQLLQTMKSEEGRIDFYAPVDKERTPPTQNW